MSENGPRNFVESKEQTIKDFRLIKPMIEYAVRQFEGFPVVAKSNEERETEAAIQSDLTCGNDVCIFTLDTLSLVCNVASRIQPNKNFSLRIPWISWGWSPAGGDRTGTSGGNSQRAEQTRTTQSAGNKHGAQQ